MSRIRSSLLTAAVATATLAPAATAQGAATTLAVEPAPTRVAAHDGTVMWSRLDPVTRTYSLVKSVQGGAPAPVAIAPRANGPFDIDLGTNRSGATYAVYTRDDGDIYRLDVTTGNEVEGRQAQLADDRRARPDDHARRDRLHPPRAWLRPAAHRHTSASSKGSRLIVKHRSLVHAELSITHVAYVVTGPGPISDNGARYVRIRNLKTGADRQVYRAVSGGANYANTTRPTYVASPRGFMWARTNQGSGTGNRFVRYTLRGSKLAYAQGNALIVSTAWAGNLLGTATSTALADTACNDAGVQYCHVGLSGPLQFDLRP